MPNKWYVKLIASWALFLLLHYAYEWVPILPLKAVAAVDESFFQHAKITFFAYLLASLGEYIFGRRSLSRDSAFACSRLFSTTLIPWFMFLIWFTGPAYYGRFPTTLLEILFANIVLVLAGLCALLTEHALEGLEYRRALKAMLIALFLVSVSLYVILTFRQPWHDVFADPLATGVLWTGHTGV